MTVTPKKDIGLLSLWNGKVSYLLTILLSLGLWAPTIYFLLRLPNIPVIHDTSFFHYISQQLLQGQVPYRDIFDINLPGIYVIHMLVLSLFGRSDSAWTTFLLIWTGLTALAAGWFIWRISRLSAILIPALMINQSLNVHIYSIGQRDSFLVLFLFLGMGLFASAWEEDSARDDARNNPKTIQAKLFGCGLALGATLSLKPTPVFFIAALLAMLMLRPFLKRQNQINEIQNTDWKPRLKRSLAQSLALASGAALIPLGIAAWLAVSGGLNAFLDIMLNFTFSVYGSLYREDMLNLLLRMFVFMRTPLLYIPLLLIGMFSQKTKINSVRVWLALIAVLFGCFHFLFQGKGFEYQDMPFLMGSLLLEGMVFGLLIQGNPTGRVMGFAWVVVFAILLASQALSGPPYHADTLRQMKPAVPLLVSDMQRLGLTSEDKIQVMDTSDGGLHSLFLLNHRLATRYTFDSPFLLQTDKPYVINLQKAFIADLKRDPPKWMVIYQTGWMQKETGLARFASFPQFLDLIKSQYCENVEQPYYTIYRLCADDSGQLLSSLTGGTPPGHISPAHSSPRFDHSAGGQTLPP